MRTTSIGRARYFITFIDDYSRWCETYFLKDKSEVAEKFEDYKNLETRTGRRIKAVQSDNGREFCNAKMDAIFKRAKIRRRLTTTYTPQQNGIAERKNRTLIEAARCLLIQSGLSPSFWAEAISTANYVKNRCISRSTDGSTPYELWNGRLPVVKHLKTFGERVFFLNKSPNKSKF